MPNCSKPYYMLLHLGARNTNLTSCWRKNDLGVLQIRSWRTVKKCVTQKKLIENSSCPSHSLRDNFWGPWCPENQDWGVLLSYSDSRYCIFIMKNEEHLDLHQGQYLYIMPPHQKWSDTCQCIVSPRVYLTSFVIHVLCWKLIYCQELCQAGPSGCLTLYYSLGF